MNRPLAATSIMVWEEPASMFVIPASAKTMECRSAKAEFVVPVSVLSI